MQRWNIFSIISMLAVGWLALSATVMYFSDGAPSAMVLFPSERLMRNLPPSISIVNGSAISVTFSSTEAGMTKSLYRAGAWFILPAGLTGCLRPPEAFKNA